MRAQLFMQHINVFYKHLYVDPSPKRILKQSAEPFPIVTCRFFDHKLDIFPLKKSKLCLGSIVYDRKSQEVAVEIE